VGGRWHARNDSVKGHGGQLCRAMARPLTGQNIAAACCPATPPPGPRGCTCMPATSGTVFPVLPPGASSCRGRSLSGVCPERSGGTRPQGVPLTAGFRGDRIARRREDGPGRCGEARSAGYVTVGTGGGRVQGNGAAAAARAVRPNAKARAWPPPTSGQTPQPTRAATAGTLACPTLPPVVPAPMPGAWPGPGEPVRRSAPSSHRESASRGRTSKGACGAAGAALIYIWLNSAALGSILGVDIGPHWGNIGVLRRLMHDRSAN
jgi:hypothetical protein